MALSPFLYFANVDHMMTDASLWQMWQMWQLWQMWGCVTCHGACHVCHTRELYMLMGLGVSDYWHEEQPLNESSVHSSGHHTHSQHSTGGNGTLWSTDPQSEVSSIKMLLGVFGSHFGSLLYSFVAVADRLCWYQISLSWPYSDILKYRYFMWIASNSQLRK